MMQNLAIDQGGLLMVESASLPVGDFAKFQPHSKDFVDLTNPKAVLESKLRKDQFFKSSARTLTFCPAEV